MAIELRDYQSDALACVRRDWRDGRKRCLVSIPTGLGKCVSPDTWVWSAGLRRFGNLKRVGERRIRARSGMRSIVGWHDDGVREGRRLRLSCGLEIDGTLEHRVWVMRPDTSEDWCKLGDLQGDEYVGVAVGAHDWGLLHGSSVVLRGQVAWRQLYGKSGGSVPTGVLLGDYATVAGFVRGVFFGGQYFTTASEVFAEQMQLLVIGLGFGCERHYAGLHWQVCVESADAPAWRRWLSEDVERPEIVRFYAISDIMPSTVGRIDCEVEHEHCFIGNGIVNHNTWLFIFAIWGAKANGLRSLVLVNTDELIDQTVKKLTKVGVTPGIVKGSVNEWNREVVVASIQTMSKRNRLYNLPPNHFGLVITDEAHYANATSYQSVLWYFSDAWHLGVTATPFRGDKKSLAGAGWDALSYVYPMQRAVKEGWLAPLRFVRVDTGVKIGGASRAKSSATGEADFNAKALERVINTPERNDLIVRAAIEHLIELRGPLSKRMRRTIAFCAGVDHSVDLANAFRHRGIEAFAIYGSMKIKARRMIIAAHQAGRFPVLCNCNILTHGYDDPAIEAVIMARPTQSKVLYLQELGRGLRLSPETGKVDCIALDVVDVSGKHAIAIGAEIMDLEEQMEEVHGSAHAEGPMVFGEGQARDALAASMKAGEVVVPSQAE